MAPLLIATALTVIPGAFHFSADQHDAKTTKSNALKKVKKAKKLKATCCLNKGPSDPVQKIRKGIHTLQQMSMSSYWHASGNKNGVFLVLAGLPSRSAKVEFIRTRASEWISASDFKPF